MTETGAELVHIPASGRTHGPSDDGRSFEGERQKGERGHEERKAAVLLRRQHVAERLVAHWPYRAIARELGVSLGTIAKDAAKIRENWRERMAQSYEEHVAEEFGKLDQVEMALMPKVLHGGRDGGASIAAVQSWIAIQDRRARLMGLDKPVKADLTVHVDLEAEKARGHELVDELRRLRERDAG